MDSAAISPDGLLEMAQMLNVSLTFAQAGQLLRYADILVDWNTRVNLTAITEHNAVISLHFLDSLTVLRALPEQTGTTLLDVGAGAGFPGLALKIARPDLQVTLIDGTAKKIAFCQHVIDSLGLSGVNALHGRAEELAQHATHRERYGVVVARAVAALPTLVEYLLPFARVGGQCISMKASAAESEARDAAVAIRKLGGSLNRIESVVIPGLPDKRALIIVDKTSPTPARYPRSAGAPRNSPLR
jgi:16S rRNA (guanine527-N7)-methyltransferase